MRETAAIDGRRPRIRLSKKLQLNGREKKGGPEVSARQDGWFCLREKGEKGLGRDSERVTSKGQAAEKNRERAIA